MVVARRGAGDGTTTAVERLRRQLAALEPTLHAVRAATASVERLATTLHALPTLPAIPRPDPDDAALFKLLLATWPRETLVATLWNFLAAFAALRTADTAADLAAAASRVVEFPAFVPPRFPRKAVRRVIATHGRGPAARRWVVEHVLVPTVVELMQGEVFRPQRVRFDRQWTKIVRGFFRPSRTAAAIPYRPGTIAEVIPAQLSAVHFYRWLRQRTQRVAAERILAEAALGRTESADAALAVTTCGPNTAEVTVQAASTGADIEEEDLLRRVLASLDARDRELVLLRLADTPHRIIAERLGLPSEGAVRTRWCRLRPALRDIMSGM
jgi:hypothetical protein